MSLPPSAAIAENPWLAQPVSIDQIAAETPGVATYRLRLRDSERHARYRCQPGQFNMLYLPGAGEIPISMSGGGDGDGPLDHTVRVAGNVTRTLSRLKPGDSLGLRGPYGTSWPMAEAAGADVVLIGGGIGLAPLRPVVYSLVAERGRFGNAALLYGARTPDGLLYTREYDAWGASRIDVQTTVDRAPQSWCGNAGVVPLLLGRLRPLTPENTLVMLCGPEVMIRYTVRTALDRGLRKDQIWVSLERNMQCAVAQCGHCQLGPAFVCKDGPVFRYDRIEPFLQIEGL